MDLNPLTTPENVLTDCVNGSFVTFNGDELVLQNDMGNVAIRERIDTITYEPIDVPFEDRNEVMTTTYKDVNLGDGFVPLGVKEYGGVMYIVSGRIGECVFLDGKNRELGIEVKDYDPFKDYFKGDYVKKSVFDGTKTLLTISRYYRCIGANVSTDPKHPTDSQFWTLVATTNVADDTYNLNTPITSDIVEVQVGSYPSPQMPNIKEKTSTLEFTTNDYDNSESAQKQFDNVTLYPGNGIKFIANFNNKLNDTGTNDPNTIWYNILSHYNGEGNIVKKLYTLRYYLVLSNGTLDITGYFNPKSCLLYPTTIPPNLNGTDVDWRFPFTDTQTGDYENEVYSHIANKFKGSISAKLELEDIEEFYIEDPTMFYSGDWQINCKLHYKTSSDIEIIKIVAEYDNLGIDPKTQQEIKVTSTTKAISVTKNDNIIDIKMNVSKNLSGETISYKIIPTFNYDDLNHYVEKYTITGRVLLEEVSNGVIFKYLDEQCLTGPGDQGLIYKPYKEPNLILLTTGKYNIDPIYMAKTSERHVFAKYLTDGSNSTESLKLRGYTPIFWYTRNDNNNKPLPCNEDGTSIDSNGGWNKYYDIIHDGELIGLFTNLKIKIDAPECTLATISYKNYITKNVESLDSDVNSPIKITWGEQLTSNLTLQNSDRNYIIKPSLPNEYTCIQAGTYILKDTIKSEDWYLSTQLALGRTITINSKVGDNIDYDKITFSPAKFKVAYDITSDVNNRRLYIYTKAYIDCFTSDELRNYSFKCNVLYLNKWSKEGIVWHSGNTNILGGVGEMQSFDGTFQYGFKNNLVDYETKTLIPSSNMYYLNLKEISMEELRTKFTLDLNFNQGMGYKQLNTMFVSEDASKILPLTKGNTLLYSNYNIPYIFYGLYSLNGNGINIGSISEL